MKNCATFGRQWLKWVLISLCLLLILCSCGKAREEATPAVDFELSAASGETIRLSDFAGKVPVVVTFWASWCPDCTSEMPYVYEAANEYDDSEIVFLMVNSTSGVKETKEKAQAYLEENEMGFRHVLWDLEGEAAEKYGLYFLPTTIFVNREGNIVSRYDDVISKKTLSREVKALLSQ